MILLQCSGLPMPRECQNANAIDNARRKVAILLNEVGAKNYELLRALFAPDQPNTKSFEQLTEKLKEHYQPKPTFITEWYRFHQRNQRQGETVLEYLAALRSLSKDSQFENFLEQALRDRLVCGLFFDATKRRLLIKKDLMLEKACELAVAMEAAGKETAAMQLPKSQSMNTLRGLTGKKGKGRGMQAEGRNKSANTCHRCGKKGHKPQNCQLIEAECFKCGKKGHIASACFSKKTQRTHNQAKAIGRIGRYPITTQWARGKSNQITARQVHDRCEHEWGIDDYGSGYQCSSHSSVRKCFTSPDPED